MMHVSRVHQLIDVATASELAEKLVTQGWALCVGFRHQGFLFLNDATSEDGAQEYAVFHEKTGRQVESITFSWMATIAKGLEVIQEILDGKNEYAADQIALGDAFMRPLIDAKQPHRCEFCA